MSERNLYRFMVFIIIVAFIKLLVLEDYGSVIALSIGLVPLLQDLRRDHSDQHTGVTGEQESRESE